MLGEIRLFRENDFFHVVHQIVELLSLTAEYYVTQSPIEGGRLNHVVALKLSDSVIEHQ